MAMHSFWMRSVQTFVLSLTFALLAGLAPAAHAEPWDVQSDTWVATDGLGRSLSTFEEVGPPRSDKQLGIFYFLWLCARYGAVGGPFDITRILAAHPDAMTTPTAPPWGPLHAPHHWGESIFGYYLTDDDYVLRKHAQMLSDAGIDVIIFDVSNHDTYPDTYMPLLRVFREVREAGGDTPQVAFLAPFWDPNKVATELYRDLYEPGLYSELWYRWKGKPLILADPAKIPEELQTFFTCRKTQPDYRQGPTGPNQWGWLETHPQHIFYTDLVPADGKGYDFDTPGDAEGWVSGQEGVAVTVAEGALSFTTAEAGTHIEALGLRLNAGKNTCLNIRARFPEAGIAVVSWTTSKDPEWSTSKALAFMVTEPDTLCDYTVNLGSSALWKDRVTGLRLALPPQPAGAKVTVDAIHFGKATFVAEQMTVGIGQNATATRAPAAFSEADTFGRSWHNGAKDPRPDAVHYGFNIMEQWQRALEVDPEFIFVTGWNEWIAGRFAEFNGVSEPVMFVDQFTQEYSRDIEPMKGGHGDAYYYQLVEYARRYKGASPTPRIEERHTITIDGDFNDWKTVAPSYRDDIGDTARRNYPGYGSAGPYVNTTGRNDLVEMKVARDGQSVYFYARTNAPISPRTDAHWMLLFINADRDHATGWEGYDYVVNRIVPDDDSTTLEHTADGWNWESASLLAYRVHGNELELALPLAAINQTGPLDFEFKWADNIQQPGDIMEFTLNGDSAPNSRFNYWATEKKPARKTRK